MLNQIMSFFSLKSYNGAPFHSFDYKATGFIIAYKVNYINGHSSSLQSRPLAHSTSTMLASLPFLEHTKHSPNLGFLHSVLSAFLEWSFRVYICSTFLLP